jgi:hypothetical protein
MAITLAASPMASGLLGRVVLVSAIMRFSGTPVTPLRVFAYQSKTETGRGVPMMYVLYRRVRIDTPVSIIPPSVLWLDPRVADERVRVQAVDLAKEHGVAYAAAVLNLRPSSVSAWKAHATRGTYDKFALPESLFNDGEQAAEVGR